MSVVAGFSLRRRRRLKPATTTMQSCQSHRGTEPLPSHHVTFVTPQRELTVEVDADEYLLNAAMRAGLALPFSCLQGWCTTCAGKVLEGRVDQSEALRVYPEDEQAGFVLLCSAFPRTDLRILTHQKEPMRDHRLALGLPTPRG